MYGLTTLGIIHTAISLIAVAAGVISFIQYKKIDNSNLIGKLYIYSTTIVCLTGFGIFQHGGWGPAHTLGVITLIVLGVALFASRPSNSFGKFSPYISVVAFSMTFLLHLIPAINETLTRLPYGNPMAKSPDDPRIKMLVMACFFLFLVGSAIQINWMRKNKV